MRWAAIFRNAPLPQIRKRSILAYIREYARPGEILNMICDRANTQEYTATEATAEEPTVVSLQDTPMGIAMESIAVVLILLIVITSTLLACLVYPFIWLSVKSRPHVRHKSPFSSVEAGQKDTRRFRSSDSVQGTDDDRFQTASLTDLHERKRVA
jgi:hypothetical protein